MSVKMKISLVSWIASTEADLKIGTASPPGTSPWCCISWQRLLLNPLKRPLWNIWPSRLFWVLVNAGVRSMLGKIKISDIKQIGLKCPCTPHPAFFPRTSWPKRVQTVWQQWLYQPWSLLWISHSSLIGPCAQSEHCATIWTLPETLGRIRLVFFSFKKGFDKDISPATISSLIKQTVIMCYELSDQEALTVHQVKAHDVRTFAASKAFKSGVSLEQILSACLSKSHNIFSQFYLKDVAWADSELYNLGAIVAVQQIHQ